MKPPYYRITAVCRSERCKNFGLEFSRDKKKSTYTSTAGPEMPISNIACPLCTCWGSVIRVDYVGGAQ